MRLLICNLTSSNHFLNNGMILCKLLDFTASDSVCATVTDMNNMNSCIFYKDKFTCSSHTRELGIFHGHFKDFHIGIDNNFCHKLANLLLGHIIFVQIGNFGADIINCRCAGNITAVCTAHSVTHNCPDTAGRNNSEATVILILITNKSDITFAEYFQVIYLLLQYAFF